VTPEKPFEEFLDKQIAGLRIGIPKEYWNDSLDEKVRKSAETALERFRALGCLIEEISLPHSSLALPVYYILMPSEVSSNLARFDGIKYGLSVNDQEKTFDRTSSLLETYLDSRRIGFGPEVKRRIMLGTYALSAGYYDAYYKKAASVRGLIRRDFEEAFGKVDLIFSPTTPTPAFHFGEKTDDPVEMYLSDIYTVTANLAGLPAVSFPIGTVEEEGERLPIGGQLMGKWFDEETLLSAAHAFEKIDQQPTTNNQK
jgi:aspartyl-tRNA(Asn)/glutamyl-tRNA(Gln) amidotransferase subunit A